jgi:hypothetical protein
MTVEGFWETSSRVAINRHFKLIARAQTIGASNCGYGRATNERT